MSETPSTTAISPQASRAEAPEAAPPDAGRGSGPRLVSLDAYRGLVMFTLAAGGFGFAEVAANTDSAFWEALGFQFSHTRWFSHVYGIGFSYWDMIQPAFIFIVGVAMPFSYAKRRALGQSYGRRLGHALGRSLLLVLLGVFLTSRYHDQTYWRFTNVLSQIGLGYWFVFLLLGRGVRVQLGAAGLILLGYWLAFALYPAPGPGFDYAAVGIQQSDVLPGFFAHWTKNANAAAAFDQWFLNLFPRAEPWTHHPGGYTTLNFVPSMVTMLLGIMAGELLRSEQPARLKIGRLVLGGAVCLVLAMVLGYTVSPIVKKLWTSSWTLFSGAWVLWLLALFYWLIDVRGLKRWAFPLVIVGMNPITMYMMHMLIDGWVARQLRIHLGPGLFSGTYGPIVEALAVLLVLWLICYYLYRKRMFIRI